LSVVGLGRVVRGPRLITDHPQHTGSLGWSYEVPVLFHSLLILKSRLSPPLEP
jgi:hypothetical protein